MANFAKKTLKAKKVAIFHRCEERLQQRAREILQGRLPKPAGRSCRELDFNGGDKDFKGQLTAIKGATPDAVFVPGYYTDAALICIQAKQLGPQCAALRRRRLGKREADRDRQGCRGRQLFLHALRARRWLAEKSKAFVDAYKKRYNGKSPDAMAALGYDSAMILADAMKRAGRTEGNAVRDALAATKDFDAVTGKITINAQRDARNQR